MQRGTITILLILGVATIAAVASVFFHYSNQRHSQEMWGAQTAALIDKAPEVEVMRLGEAAPGLAMGEETGTDEPAEDGEAATEATAETTASTADSEQAPAVKALEFNEVPWLVIESREAGNAKGVNNLRRALVLDTTYNWDEAPAESDPVWQYALGVTDGRDWASVLFDFDSRRVALAGGRKVAILHDEAAREFRLFFEEQFAKPAPEAAGDKAAADSDASAPEDAEPAAESAP